ncbi:MAG: phosphatidylserine decarboxylase family protein [Bacteroidales bacterium]|nr:phosphatidylserine decarboxylase family protein [Bacteroidales bacterium]
MYIHREGIKIIAVSALIYSVFVAILYFFLPEQTIFHYLFYFALGLTLLWEISFFRVPKRSVNYQSDAVVSSADGTVVVIEEVFESEYFNDKRMQISVFMSPMNVHINWFPIDGEVRYVKYHPGKFLFANHPKSSEENERNTVVVSGAKGNEVLFRQIAGMMARRIVCYVEKGTKAKQGEEFGLIRFGSRVDFFVPLTAKVNVKIGDKVKGQKTVLATFQK